MDGAIEYTTVAACVRPPRFLVGYSSGASWVANARRAISTLSGVWGGAGCVLVPVDQSGAVADDLHPMLACYDPDCVAWHPVVRQDLADDDPGYRDRFVADNRPEGVSAASLWEFAKTDVVSEPLVDQLAAVVESRCSPFPVVGHETAAFAPNDVAYLQRDGAPGAYLTRLPDELNGPVWVPDLSTVDPLVALMFETRWGSVPAEQLDRLQVFRLPELEADVPALISLATSGTPGYAWDEDRLRQAVVAVNGDAPAGLTQERLLEWTPFGRTQRGLGKIHTGFNAPVVCVVGDTAEDHALAMMCDRVFRLAVWIPLRTFLDNGQDGVAARLAARTLYRHALHDQPALLISASQPQDELTNLLTELGIPTGMNTDVAHREYVRVSDVASLPEHDGRAFLADLASFDVHLSLPSRRDSEALSLLTPVTAPFPSAAPILGRDVVWCVDVSVASDRPPTKTALASSLLAPAPAGRLREAVVRVSRYGLSYLSANMGIVIAGASPQARTAKPLLRFPSAETTFAALAAKHGARVQRSAAGQRAANCVELWGTLDAVAADLVGPTRLLLEAFIPPKSPRTGSYRADQGYAVRGIGYLTLHQAAAALGSSEKDARDTVDRLLAIKVLGRGLLLGCRRCAAQDFYSLGALTDDGFGCKTCGRNNSLSRERWYKGVTEPQWYYALDQVVTDLVAQDGDIPLLAASRLGQGKWSVQWAPELQVFWGDNEAEIDVAVVVDGRVIVGEAKSNGTLKTSDKSTTKAAERLVQAAQILQADHIVLATSRQHWVQGTRDAVVNAVNTYWTTAPKPLVSELTDLRTSSP